jgi:hypothetical protein
MAERDQKRALAEVDRAEVDLWLYEQRLKGYTIGQIAAAAALPVEHGGLGKQMSEVTVWRRVKGELGRRVELGDAKRDELRALELDRLDAVHTALVAQSGRLMAGIERAEAVGVLDLHAEDALGKVFDRMRANGESRRKLLGLDAPLEVAATITTIDSTDIALAKLVEQAREADRKAAGLAL